MPKITPTVLNAIPHDEDAFTQGLCWWQGCLYESTGLVGASRVRCIDPLTGSVLRSISVDGVWGEGLAITNGRLVQLTLESGYANIFALPELTKAGEYRYSGEGWGLARYGDLYAMTDGSDVVSFRDPDFTVVRRLPVRVGKSALRGLNDVEVASEHIYANAYYHDFVYEIAPDSGRVTRVVDCSGLVRAGSGGLRHNILNGIAYAPERGTFFMTGKNWSRIFEVTIQPPA